MADQKLSTEPAISPEFQGVDATPAMVDALTEAEIGTLLLLVDGELASDAVALAEAQALMARSTLAADFVQDWQHAKVALQQAVYEQAGAADLSRVRGRVMARIVEPVATKEDPEKATGFWGWLGELGFGKVSFVVGAAAAAAVWLIVSAGPVQPHHDRVAPVAGTLSRPVEALPNGEPSVIIEETESDGSVMVRHGEHSGDATIIWHYQPAQNGKGEG